MGYYDVDLLLAENPLWEARNFDELGYFIGPKAAADLIEESLEGFEITDDEDDVKEAKGIE